MHGYDVNSSKCQPPKANGLGGVQCGGSKSALILKMICDSTRGTTNAQPKIL